MTLTTDQFRQLTPKLVHFAPKSFLRRELGLLTAAQVLDLNAENDGKVWARFSRQNTYQPYAKDYWKERSRFLRGAGEVGCNLIVRDRLSHENCFFWKQLPAW